MNKSEWDSIRRIQMSVGVKGTGPGTIVLRCIGSFLLGIVILSSGFFWKMEFNFFHFCIFYVIGGIICGSVWPQKAWLYNIFLALPAGIMFGPLNFGDGPFIWKIPFGLAPICSALIGAYIGSRIVFKLGKREIREMRVREEGK